MDRGRRRVLRALAASGAAAVTGCLHLEDDGDRVDEASDEVDDEEDDGGEVEGESGEDRDQELDLSEERMEAFWTTSTSAAPVLVGSREYADYLDENLEISIPDAVDYDEEVVAVFGATGGTFCHRVEFEERSLENGSVETVVSMFRAEDVSCGAAPYFDHDAATVSYSSGKPEELVVSFEGDGRYGGVLSNSYELVAEDAGEGLIESYDVASYDDLDEPLRARIREALDSVYESDEVDEELRVFLEEYSYVEDSGFHELHHDVPVLHIDVREFDGEPDDYFYVDDLRGSFPEARQAFEYSARTATNGRGREGFQGLVLPEGVEEYTDSYDYMAYEVGDRVRYYEVSVEVDDPGPPYTVEAREVDIDDIVEDTAVYAIDDLEGEVQEEVESAVEDELHRLNPPRALVEGYTEGMVQVEGDFYDLYAVRR